MKTKLFEYLKKLKVLFDTYKMILGVLALFSIAGGYYATSDVSPEENNTSTIPNTQPPIGKELIIKSIPCDLEAHILELH